MATQRQELTAYARNDAFSFTPRSLDEAIQYATIISNSLICPKGLRGKPEDVLVILQTGQELGLKPMQALRTLGCINGLPFAWGDGLLALIKRHPDFVSIKEWTEGSLENKTMIAYCTITRRGQPPHTQSFSIKDAMRAGLWGKDVWLAYPVRMLQHRPRNFACRDTFPDALFGLMAENEVRNIPQEPELKTIKIMQSKGMAGFKEALGLNDDQPQEIEIMETEITEHDGRAIKLVEVYDLLDKHHIADSLVEKNLKVEGVSSLEELSDESLDKWINHLKAKE